MKVIVILLMMKGESQTMSENAIRIITALFELCIIPLLGILTRYLVAYIVTKKNEINANTESELAKKYQDMLANTICQCVIATNQTYVDALKKEGKFDLEAQKKAFEQTRDAVLAILDEESKKYLASIFGDLDLYISQQIEANVNMYKTTVV